MLLLGELVSREVAMARGVPIRRSSPGTTRLAAFESARPLRGHSARNDVPPLPGTVVIDGRTQLPSWPPLFHR